MTTTQVHINIQKRDFGEGGVPSVLLRVQGTGWGSWDHKAKGGICNR